MDKHILNTIKINNIILAARYGFDMSNLITEIHNDEVYIYKENKHANI